MTSIFGIFNRNGSPVKKGELETMQQDEWGKGNSDLLLDGPIGLGQLNLSGRPESRFKGSLKKIPLSPHEGGEICFTLAGRIDNRDELIKSTGISGHESVISDHELILKAYLNWGEDSPKHIYGDWSFAVWHARARKLFIARDHFGNTSLYYYADPHIFAFSSSRKALLALNLAPIEMDELYLAQVLVSWPAYHGERTIHKPIKRLPPAHCLTVTSEHLTLRQYWNLEETRDLHLSKKSDYVAAFREVFDEAVRCRLPSHGAIAVSLSGGLDSGSVAVTAAEFLKKENRRLIAFTSVPISDTDKYLKKEFGDESPFAQATAEYAGNIDLHKVTAETITPIHAIRWQLSILNEPAHAAGNYFWINALRQAAVAQGCRVLLNGQAGNAGISWTGSLFSQPVIYQLHHFGWRRWAKEMIKHCAPQSFMDDYRRLKTPPAQWWRSSAINPELAGRLKLWEVMLDDRSLRPRTPLEERYQILKPGRSLMGSNHAQTGTAFGLEIRDPTADARVLAFTISIPDNIFIDPKTGMDRWLIREAMKGRLPDEVRLNRRRGRQAGDIVPRLRACADEVKTALDELADGPASAYVNVPYMREVWSMIQREDTPEAFRKAGTIITRGIMAGLWVNGFYNAS